MRDVFIGSEALAQGELTRAQLRWRHEAIFPDVYAPKATPHVLWQRTAAAWLWSGRDAVVAGQAAAAGLGALWVDTMTPIELIGRRSRSPGGIIVRNERIASDEITVIAGMTITTPARTALDLARHLPRDVAVRHLDALARATGLRAEDVLELAARYPRARGLRRAEVALAMDSGAQSPRETRLRLLYLDAGFPRPRTQFRVTDGITSAFGGHGVGRAEDRR